MFLAHMRYLVPSKRFIMLDAGDRRIWSILVTYLEPENADEQCNTPLSFRISIVVAVALTDHLFMLLGTE